MSITIKKTLNGFPSVPASKVGFQTALRETGRLPGVTLLLTPVQPSDELPRREKIILDRFLSYSFTSSILIPVDTFEFTYAAPDDPRPIPSYIKEGDLVTLYANGTAVSTGIIDSLDIVTDPTAGERVTISGRDLLGQFEDQDAVSADSKQVYGDKITLDGILAELTKGTRIPSKPILRRVSTKPYLFATEPGESKLAALQRHLESLNALSWMTGTGRLVIGKPDYSSARVGEVICTRSFPQENNCLDMRAIFASTTIPNLILPIWTGQETVQERVKITNALFNRAKGPRRLRRAGHVVSKSVVVSNVLSGAAQDLAAVNALLEAGAAVGAGNSTILEAYGKREMAKYNHKELIIQATVPGHYTAGGKPYQTDQNHYVSYERAGINKEMYLFQVSYSLNEETGQRTSLSFCNKGTIVADAQSVKRKTK